MNEKIPVENTPNDRTPIRSRFIDKIQFNLELWTILVSVIFFIGVIYLNYYYSDHYNFRILSYLDLSEIFVAAFTVIKFEQVLFSTIKFILVGIGFYAIASFIRENKSDQSEADYVAKLRIVLLVAVFFDVVIGGNPEFFGADINKRLQGYYGGVIIIAILTWLTVGKETLKKVYHFLKPSTRHINLTALIMISITLLLNAYISGELKYKDITIFHKTYGTKIYYLEKDSIISDSQFYFIDKSKDFIFMWSVKDNSMTIIPMSEIKKLVVHYTLPLKKTTNMPFRKPIDSVIRDTLVIRKIL